MPRSPLRTMVGRDSEAERIGHAADVVRGRGSTILVMGEARIGKTRLVNCERLGIGLTGRNGMPRNPEISEARLSSILFSSGANT